MRIGSRLIADCSIQLDMNPILHVHQRDRQAKGLKRPGLQIIRLSLGGMLHYPLTQNYYLRKIILK